MERASPMMYIHSRVPMSEHTRKGINRYVAAYLRSLGSLEGRLFVDLPAGKGIMSNLLREQGATVEAYDLFPEFFEAPGLTCRPADMNLRLPIPDEHADAVLCQEGIEHLPNPLFSLREMNRILKPGGRLILTTPNNSSLRARLSNFLLEGHLFGKLPINEGDAVAIWDVRQDRCCFHHVFRMGAQYLRILARLAGFRIVEVRRTALSRGSAALGVFLPLVLLANGYAYWRSWKRLSHVPQERRRAILREVLRLNLNPRILFGKKLFFVFEKDRPLNAIAQEFFPSSAGE